MDRGQARLRAPPPDAMMIPVAADTAAVLGAIGAGRCLIAGWS
jgi:hypothetical protein